METATKQCKLLPENMPEQVKAVLCAAAQDGSSILARVDELIDGPEGVMIKAGFEVKRHE